MTSFQSKVVSGHGVGQSLGYPTLNFTVPKDFELETGVYACELKVQNLKGILFYGPRATFGDEQNSLEVHLFDLPTDLKITEAAIKVGVKIREVMKFENKEELIAQIEKDCAKVRQLLK